jgi:hypothetical protein
VQRSTGTLDESNMKRPASRKHGPKGLLQLVAGVLVGAGIVYSLLMMALPWEPGREMSGVVIGMHSSQNTETGKIKFMVRLKNGSVVLASVNPGLPLRKKERAVVQEMTKPVYPFIAFRLVRYE